MKKLGFVVPWYGENNPGGAEMLLRELTGHLFMSGIELEILSTCIKEFASDWGTNFYKPGVTTDSRGITVRRFKANKRDRSAFDGINLKLMRGLSITDEEEEIFIKNSATSSDLISYMDENKDQYEMFIYTPYMFGTTIEGCRKFPSKSVVISCFHDESYFYMKAFKDTFEKVKGLIYNAYPEMELANSYYDLKDVKQAVLGTGVDTTISGDESSFRAKENINEPYILYAGRKDAGKNVDTLIDYHSEFIRRAKADDNSFPKLVLIGGGSVDIPDDMKDYIIDLGFVDVKEKYDSMAGALFLCQPSTHESFSIVIMESWLLRRPVLVAENCEVTFDFCNRSNGGLFFKDFYDYEGAVNYFMAHEDTNKIMGENGREFVISNFSWDVVLKRTIDFFGSMEN